MDREEIRGKSWSTCSLLPHTLPRPRPYPCPHPMTASPSLSPTVSHSHSHFPSPTVSSADRRVDFGDVSPISSSATSLERRKWTPRLPTMRHLHPTCSPRLQPPSSLTTIFITHARLIPLSNLINIFVK